MLRAILSPPLNVTFREDGVLKVDGVHTVNLRELRGDQAPPEEGFVVSCARKFKFEDGSPIPAEVLRGYDLEAGLRNALREALGKVGLH